MMIGKCCGQSSVTCDGTMRATIACSEPNGSAAMEIVRELKLREQSHCTLPGRSENARLIRGRVFGTSKKTSRARDSGRQQNA